MRTLLALAVLGSIRFISGCGGSDACNTCSLPPPRRVMETSYRTVEPLPPPAPVIAAAPACTTNFCPPPTPL